MIIIISVRAPPNPPSQIEDCFWTIEAKIKKFFNGKLMAMQNASILYLYGPNKMAHL